MSTARTPTIQRPSVGGAVAARTGRQRLTAHEHRIAVLAADGRSNQDIGDRLCVGARAVEHHLTSVYRKLAIRGRRQLPTALVDHALVDHAGLARRAPAQRSTRRGGAR